MRAAAIAIVVLACGGPASAAPHRLQREIQSFLSAWAKGPSVSEAAVARFYAPRVHYYGHWESRFGVLRDKRALARRWPNRRYRLLPGSESARCNRDQSRCTVTAVLDWRARSPQRDARANGAATLWLDLTRRGRVLKIVAEGGNVLARAAR